MVTSFRTRRVFRSLGRVGATLSVVLSCLRCGGDAQPDATVEYETAVPDAGSENEPETPLTRPTEATSRLCYGGCDDSDASRAVSLARPLCPSTDPIVGEACTSPSLACSYGDAVVSWCRRHYECRNGFWQEPETIGRYAANLCSNHPPGLCPKAPPHEKPCEVAEVEQGSYVPCEYPGLTCWCEASRREAGNPGTWQCYGPPLDIRCPSTLPNIGEGCASSGAECSYVPTGCYSFPYSSVFCFEGQWEAIANPLVCAN
jgi:hypothetical protein